MKARFSFLVILLIFLILSCSGETPPVIEDVSPPALAGSGQPHLAVDENDDLWLSWIEPTDIDGEHALRYASFDGSAWTEPESAARGSDWFVNWADVPSIVPLPDGRVAAHYLVSSGPHIFAYDVRITQQDRWGTWQHAITPHADGTETEHGFVSLLPWNDGDLLAIWLDGREMEVDADDAGSHGSGAMTLRGAIIDAEGQTKQKDLLDDRVCECCPTSGTLTDNGALFVYRDRTEAEIRNISLIRYNNEGWSDPYELHDDNWQINGCPVNGPALAARGDNVVAGWFTAPDDNPQVKVAFSNDSGATFGEPIVIDEDRPGGHVDLVLLDDGTAIISWYGREDDTSVLKAQAANSDGTIGTPFTVVKPMPDMRTGIPKMAHTRDMLMFGWVEENRDEGSRAVKVKRMTYHQLL